MVDTAPKQASDRETVALKQSDSEERCDGIESNDAANVDETQTGADGTSENTGVSWHGTLLIDTRDPFRVRETSVSGKGEKIATDGSKVGDVREDEKSDSDAEHSSHPARRHGLTKDVDGRVRRGVSQGIFDAGDVVAYSEDSREHETEVDEVDADDGLRDRASSVADLFGHVSSSVDTNLGVDTTELTNHDRQRQAGPAAAVFEASPDLLVGGARSVDPNGDDEGEVGEDVNGEDGVLPVRQNSGTKNVTSKRNADGANDEKSCVPCWESIVGFVDGDDALDKSSDKEHTNSVTRLPGKSRSPSISC